MKIKYLAKLQKNIKEKLMKKVVLSTVMASMMFSVAPLSASEGFALFSDAKFNGHLNPRYESVSIEDSAKKDANALTMRATLGIKAKLLGIDGLSMKVDGTTVQTLGAPHYDDLSATRNTAYEVVADPEQTRFTQAYLEYAFADTQLKLGRQVINLDNWRFIGSVDWRQMMQSLDALTVTNTSIDGLTLTAGYIYSYATIFKEPSQQSNSVILNGAYALNAMLKVTLYNYMISSEKGAYGSDTYGLALTGDIPAASAKISYRAEYAKQDDATFKTVGAAKKENDASYYNLNALANISGVLLGAGQEYLSGTNGSDGKTAFSTPLATLHAFNGWADKFLATPTGGLVDSTATLGYTAPGLGKAMLIYHNFETDVDMGGESDLGKEFDILYTNAIPGLKGLNGLAKAAYFKGGQVAGYTKDVSKIWLQLDYKF